MSESLASLVYLLCLLTSAACAWLLGRSYRQTRVPLLFWSCCCFALLAANNLVLVLDFLIWPHVDLRVPRLWLSLAAVSSLIWGLVWEAERD